jgi:hypothetical protein
MEQIAGIFGFMMSIFSAAISCYFWLVRARQERPRLEVCKAEPRFGGYANSSCGDPIKLTFEVKVIVANYSTLPNALLGLTSWVKTCEGAWLEAVTTPDPKTPLPLNVPPLQTVRLNLTSTVALPVVPEGDACRNTNETFVLYRDRYLAQPIEVKVELSALGNKPFTGVLAATKAAA